MAAQAGASLRELQARLGHSTAAAAMTYQHATAERDRALAERMAAALPPEQYDAEIVEMHHRMKVDAPSGTALLLGEAAAEGRGVVLADTRVSTRDGHTGPRRPGDIGFATLRGGTVVGDHSVVFAGPGERITVGHHAEDRAIFARGALRAALWGQDKGPGEYDMADVLGL